MIKKISDMIPPVANDEVLVNGHWLRSSHKKPTFDENELKDLLKAIHQNYKLKKFENCITDLFYLINNILNEDKL